MNMRWRCGALGDLGLRIQRGEFSLAQLFDEDMLGDDLEAWLAESALMKRTFRSCAIISGLIERRYPGEEKSRRQVTISTDLVYDVLRKHQPDHILLRAARADAATGLLDIRRLGEMLSRIRGRIVHKALDHVSPLAVPVMLEIGRETVYGEASDAILGRSGGRTDQGSDAVTALSAPRDNRGSAFARADGTRRRRWLELRCTPIAPVSCTGRSRGCWSSPICISKKARASPRRGMLLPPYDTAATLARLGASSSRITRRARVIALGDSFHDNDGPARLSDEDRASLVARCSAAATGSGSPAITIRCRPKTSAACSTKP